MSLHEHILLPVFTRVCVCMARRGYKSFERYNLLSKTALFVPGILSTCPLHLSPATLTLNFVLYFSLYHPLLPVFFPLPLSRFTPTCCTLSASPLIRGPFQGRSRAISVRLIRFLLITQPLSEQENTRLSLRLHLSQIVHLFTWANRINGEENWSNHSFHMGQQACLSAGVWTMTHPWSPAPIYVTLTAMISFSWEFFFKSDCLTLHNISKVANHN